MIVKFRLRFVLVYDYDKLLLPNEYSYAKIFLRLITFPNPVYLALNSK